MTLVPSAQGGEPLRILMSAQGAARLHSRIKDVLGSLPHVLVSPGAGEGDIDADVAFISRDVTGLSTKHEILPATQRFYDAMLASKSLRWVHIHSAGADRPIFGLLRQRGVIVTTSSGANASVVAQTALAGILALGRQFPLLAEAQREHRWAPLIGTGLPRDLQGQTATIIGWGPIGQTIGRILLALGLKLIVIRQSAQSATAGAETVTFDAFQTVLPRTDWLILACPLTPATRSLVDATALSLLPSSAHLVNVARGEVVEEDALINALGEGRLAGAYLDVFAHEPLSQASLLWDMKNVIVTPHSAGFSDGNGERVTRMFLDNLLRWVHKETLANISS
ncbi:MAG: putative Glyoxylate/hydroxypyruvate reductase [Herminiimonas sp.]|nr:putative Glyoxylate/hydroxypyruvate reductase [Herminiimonas sp.]